MNGLITQFFQSYLVGYMCIFSVTSGGLAVLMLHLLVGGEWGRVSRRPLRAIASMWPWVTLLFIPVILGIHHIYPWSHPEVAEVLGRKRPYLTPFFFSLRAAAYFIYFNLLARRMVSLLNNQKPDSPPDYFQKSAALGMVSYFIVASLAVFDFMMSLEPHWASTLYGVMLIMGGGLTTWALLIVTLAWLQNPARPVVVSQKASHDLGNLMFAFTIFWTYMAVSQYIIIWSGNLPEEIPWYLVRNSGGWKAVSVVLVLAQFLLPFLLLLAQQRKKNLSRLVKVAAYMLCIRVLDMFWLIVPDFSPAHFRLHVLDFIVIGGLIFLWFTFYRRNLSREWLA
jgi:hypothetical protein